MSHETNEKKQEGTEEKNSIQPEPETLHTTDPQEKMEGPVSSLVQGMKEEFENKDKSKAEADKERNEDM